MPAGAHAQVLSSPGESACPPLVQCTGASRILVEVPERPALWRLDLSPDATFLGSVSTPNLHDQNKPRRSVLDIWDYARLLERSAPVVTRS